MEQFYKLDHIKELAVNDQDFINRLIQTFLDEVPADARKLKEAVEHKDYKQSYQIAHKLKPTITLFEIGVIDDLIKVQDWAKFEQTDKDVSDILKIILTAIDHASQEIKEDFNL